jgi:hypothetical protein
MFHLFGVKEQQGDEKNLLARNESLAQSLDRSMHELQQLANFYHRRSYPEYAQEINRTIDRISRNGLTKRA